MSHSTLNKSGSIELLDRVELLLSAAVLDNPTVEDRQGLLSLVEELRDSLLERDHQIEEMVERSEAMARAQADAIVHSAEIIDELELTKQRLSEARGAAEKAAEDTKRLADTVFERTNDGVLVFSDGKCIACNDNASEMLSCEREDIINGWPAAFDAAVFGDGKPAGPHLKKIYSHVNNQLPVVVEIQLENREGCLYWVEITMSPFAMSDSGHVLVIIHDISAHKNFEIELKRQRDFLDNIINAVPDELSVTAIDRTIVLANEAYCKALGKERAGLIGNNASYFIPEKQRPQVYEIEKELVNTGECKDTLQTESRADGSQAIVSVKRSIFGDETGNQFIVSTARDITEDRTREDRLRLLASVFNGASEGVAILSQDGHIREANPAFLEMTSSLSCSPLSKSIESVFQFDMGCIADILEDVRRGQPWSGKGRTYTNDSEERHFWISLSPSFESNSRHPRLIALISDITELEQAQEKLRSQALYDNITGLPNRSNFRDQLQKLTNNRKMQEQGVAVCFIDLDDFKHVNDTIGHHAGDMLLSEVGGRIRRVMGEGAFVSRFGGDEFAIIISSAELQMPHLMHRLEELLKEIRKPFQLGNTEANIGMSVGVANFPEHGEDVGTLMCAADIAMYAAKSAGKNQIRVFTPELEDGVKSRHQLQTKLRRALQDEEITLHFQPKVCAMTGKSIGCEALARWQTSDGTFISPGEFIPVAEQSGLILALGEQVFRKAAYYATEWASHGHEASIAVNVSPHQLRHPGFVSQVKEILEETAAKPEWFELEITEYAMMEDVGRAIEVIDELAEIGFRIAIDDFGTGYSSLSYLKHFNIHTIKIDLSFVRDITTDWQSVAVVRSIVSLGSGLGLNIVAEGVETLEQAEILAELGCSSLQGYLFSRPMPSTQYLEWIEENALESQA